MFNIAFPELIVIGIVAIFVIGPDKLPKIVRGAGLMMGRMQRYLNEVKNDLDSELRSEDLKRLQDELSQHDRGLNEELRKGTRPVETILQESEQSRQQASREKEAPSPDAQASGDDTPLTQNLETAIKTEHN